MNQRITVERLSQQQADQWLRSLPDGMLNAAFHVERERKERQETMWTCPQPQRTYYLARVDSLPRLLAGIEQYFNISSFAKVADRPRRFAAMCLKKLIEEILIPECLKLEPQKDSIHSAITTTEGRRLMEEIKMSLPEGIERVCISPGPGCWSVKMCIRNGL